MRSLELFGTPFFVQPLRLGPEVGWFSHAHSTAVDDENRFCDDTKVVRLFSSPTGHGFGLAFGRWVKIPDEEIRARQVESRVRSLHDRYNKVAHDGNRVEFIDFWQAFGSVILQHLDDDPLDLDDEEDVEYLMQRVQEILVVNQ